MERSGAMGFCTVRCFSDKFVCVQLDVRHWFLVQKFKRKPVPSMGKSRWGRHFHHKLFQTRWVFFALDHPALTYIFTLTTETLHKGGWNPVDNLQLKESARKVHMGCIIDDQIMIRHHYFSTWQIMITELVFLSVCPLKPTKRKKI